MNHERRRIRPYREEDKSAVVAVWHRSGRAAYTYRPTWQAFTLEPAREVFRDVRFGISPPPESAPDVEYHWRPADADE